MMFVHTARKGAAALRMYGLAWKLRKLDFDIPRGGLVLDVGSGAAPNPYADVLLEYDPQGRETNSGPARANGKMLVWGDLQRTPFRDRVFDYAMAFHVLEHVLDPAQALGELQRVARRGYIETPNELFDYVIPYHDHRNRVSYDGEVLRVMRKERWNVERFAERFGQRRSRQVFDLLIADPANLHVCYHWTDKIDYLTADEVIRDGVEEDSSGRHEPPPPISPWLNALVTRFIRRPRLTEERLISLLRCVSCESTSLRADRDGLICDGCGRVYGRIDGWFDLRP